MHRFLHAHPFGGGLRALVATAALLTAFSAASPAALAAKHHHPKPRPRPAATARQTTVLGHPVRIVWWRPGFRGRDGRTAVAHVTWGNRRTVPKWTANNFAGINGSTWEWGTLKPIGLLRSNGRWISRSGFDRPAVGFYSTGGVVFGGTSAVRGGAANIIGGEAYLVWKGVPLRTRADAPWANAGQYGCGPKGTDGLGCFRSVIVRFRGGRVGLIEIGYASMPVAARVLVRLNVTMAMTVDSGGSANEYIRNRGSFGITSFSGMTWQRPVPTAVVVRR